VVFYGSYGERGLIFKLLGGVFWWVGVTDGAC